MASNIVNDGKFYIVDLETQSGLCVAVIPDFWLHDTNFCYYPAKRGDVACGKREQPNSTWLKYKCVYRGVFDTFSQARDKVSKAVLHSDINTASESEGNRLGRGKRIKRTRAVYSPTPNHIQESSTEEEMESEFERTGSSGVPPMPNGLAETFNRSMVQSSLIQSTQSQVGSPGFYSSVNAMEKSSLTQSTQHPVDTPGFYSSVNAMEKSSLTQSTQSQVERPGFNSSVNAMEKSSFTQSTESQVESPGFYSEKYVMENHYEKTSDSGEPIELHTSLSQQSTTASSHPAPHVQPLPLYTHLLPLPSHPVTQTQRSTSIPGPPCPS